VVLEEVLPEVFSIMKDTARPFFLKENQMDFLQPVIF